MKITKSHLRRIIREEKARIVAEQRDDRSFLMSMKTIMEQLMIMDPRTRVQSAETLIANLESVIDQALSGLPDSQGRRMTEEFEKLYYPEQEYKRKSSAPKDVTYVFRDSVSKQMARNILDDAMIPAEFGVQEMMVSINDVEDVDYELKSHGVRFIKQ